MPYKHVAASPSQAGTVLAVSLWPCPVSPAAPRHPRSLPRTTPQNRRGSLLSHITAVQKLLFQSCQIRETDRITSHSQTRGRCCNRHPQWYRIIRRRQQRHNKQATCFWKTSYHNSPASHQPTASCCFTRQQIIRMQLCFTLWLCMD